MLAPPWQHAPVRFTWSPSTPDRSGRRRATGALTGFAVLLAGCNDDGRELADAPPVAIVDETIPPSTDDVAQTQPTVVLSVSSPAIVDGQLVADHTCDGADASPPLVLSGIPADAAAVAIVATSTGVRDGGVDLDADGLDDADGRTPVGAETVHWAVVGVGVDVAVIDAGEPPAGAQVAPNADDPDPGADAWFGPCPAPGTASVGEIRVHALAERFDLADDVDAASARDLIEASSTFSSAVGFSYVPPPT